MKKNKHSRPSERGEREHQHKPDRLLPAWVSEFADGLRQEAERRRELTPQDPVVCALSQIAVRLEAAAREYCLEELTVQQAAAESGYTQDHLYRLLKKQGAIQSAGSGRQKRIRRCDLPRKPVSRPNSVEAQVDTLLGEPEG